MFEVTKKEQDAVMGIQGIYYSLRTSAEKVACALRYDHRLSPSTQSTFGFFKWFSKSKSTKELKAATDEKRALLEALIILQAEFEVCMPRIFDGKLYFDFKDLGDRQCNSCRRNLGEAQTSLDLIECLKELEERITVILATPEIHEVVSNSNNHPYCLALAKENLGVSNFYRLYLKTLQESNSSGSTGANTCAGNASQKRGSHQRRGKRSRKK